MPTAYEGMKVRRLYGVGSRTKLMSRGAIRGLAHALCLDGQTRSTANAGTPFSEAVHGELCALPLDERIALRAMLLTLH